MYSKYVMSITNVEAVEDTSSPAFNSSSGFSLFGPSSPIAHETQFSSRRGSTPKGTEFSKRSPTKEEDPMNDPRVKATILDLQSKIREMEAELSRKEKELMEVSRKLAQTLGLLAKRDVGRVGVDLVPKLACVLLLRLPVCDGDDLAEDVLDQAADLHPYGLTTFVRGRRDE